MPAQENLATASSGAKVSLATSYHPQYPAQNVIDGNSKTFWVTTGLYPQELIVSLPKTVNLKRVAVTCTKVAHVTTEVSTAEKPAGFERLTDQDVEDTDQSFQMITPALPKSQVAARHIRFIFTKGHGPFVSVHKVVIYGGEIGSQTDTDEGAPLVLAADFLP
ncbi:galactose-binding domain-like protein [Fimicolochytrium jonesii]|uniref:galactose-binding domain-like protein n=1 Tax=Fimicolochytrium jonesii TaxID=1396493 RepID=UPI0022FE1E0B|nr:galactose-binding domain-like protein [Fimicolochytrium jonesii]KAI8820776.1 galactose-binding domain-like protein [Fimicolochytrium jonesii]